MIKISGGTDYYIIMSLTIQHVILPAYLTYHCIIVLQSMFLPLELDTLFYGVRFVEFTILWCIILFTPFLPDTILHPCMIVCVAVLNSLISYLLACTCMSEPHHYDPVHICLLVHATWLNFTYSLGCFLTTMDLHVQISEFGLWWPLPWRIGWCNSSVIDQR